jgi:chromosome segregation ATPase
MYSNRAYIHLKAEIASKSDQIGKLNEEIEMMRSQLNSSFLNEMHEQFEECKSQLIEMRELNDQLTAEKETYSNQLREANEILESMQTECQNYIEVQSHLHLAKTQLSQAIEQNATLASEIESLKSEFELQRIELADNSASLSAELDSYKKKFAEMKSFISGCEQQFYTTQEKNKSLSDEIDRLKSEMNCEQEKMVGYLGQIQSLSNTLIQKDGEFEEVKKQDSLKQEIIDAKSAQLAEMEDVISSLEETAAKLDSDKKKYEEESNVLRSKCVGLERELGEYKSETTTKIEHLQEEILRKLEEFESQKMTMKSDYEKLRRESEIQAELAQKVIDAEKDALRSLRAENEVVCEEIRKVEETRRELDMEVKLLRTQLESMTVDVSRVNTDNNRLAREKETLRLELVDLKSRFGEATIEKEKLLKEIVDLTSRQSGNNDRQIEFHMKLEEKFEQLKSRLDKTKRMSGNFSNATYYAASSVSSTNLNETVMDRINDQIQAKVNFTISFYYRKLIKNIYIIDKCLFKVIYLL